MIIDLQKSQEMEVQATWTAFETLAQKLDVNIARERDVVLSGKEEEEEDSRENREL